MGRFLTVTTALIVVSLLAFPDGAVVAQDADPEATIAALQTQVAELAGTDEAPTATPSPRRRVPTAEAEAEEEADADAAVNLEIIIDVSGSMSQLVDTGDTRMAAAKQVLADVIDAIPDRSGINVGLRIYGHQGDNSAAGQDESCQSSELVVPIDGVEKGALNDEVDGLEPTGWTPIALSLERAEADFADAAEGGANYVVLVTDGLETCGGDPCDAAGEINAGDLSVTTSVIGFGLTPEEQATIGCIAEEGGGDVLGAANAVELSDALFEVLSTPVPDIQTPTPAPRAADPGSRDNPIPLGSAANIGAEWFVSVVDVVPDATDLVLTENPYNDPPEEERQFFIVTISATYEGEGSSTLPVNNALSVVGESSVAYQTFDPGCGVIPNPVPYTDVFAGGRVEGNVCWSIETADVDSLVMFSEDYVEFDRERRVWFSLEAE